MPFLMGILERYLLIQDRIRAAASSAGRNPMDVTLVAVSKTFDVDAIRPLLEAGHRVFGENRVQEAQAKWPALKREYPDVELHLIGPLQSNKAAETVALFDVIETVNRKKIVDALAHEAGKQGRIPAYLIQVNTGDESQKAGVGLADADAFIIETKRQVIVSGLMCIPPLTDSAAKHFALLADLGRTHQLPVLSMGMSSDFEDAIRAGATHIRVGSAIFGTR
jgi:PLP dependent protein